MTGDEAERVLLAFGAYWRTELSEDQIAAWMNTLALVPYAPAMRFVDEFARSSDWVPTHAQLFQACQPQRAVLAAPYHAPLPPVAPRAERLPPEEVHAHFEAMREAVRAGRARYEANMRSAP